MGNLFTADEEETEQIEVPPFPEMEPETAVISYKTDEEEVNEEEPKKIKRNKTLNKKAKYGKGTRKAKKQILED